MKPTNEQIQAILGGAPDGATHCTDTVPSMNLYAKVEHLGGFYVSLFNRWESYPIYAGIHLLSDLREVLTLLQRVQELESQLKEREPKRWFTYCDNDGYVEHETEDKAKQYGDAIIQTWLDHCWDEGVAGVRMGVVTHAATQGERTYPEGKINEEGCDEAGVWWNADWDYQVDWSLDDVSITIEGAEL